MGGVRGEKAAGSAGAGRGGSGDGEDAGGTRQGHRRHLMRFDAIAGLADRLADEWAVQLGLSPEQVPQG
ncbi:hypothetical protein ACF073_04715 [Streptomyces sp. NPDC015171]|uniref:hypothetical protein n=1 Tax=Streptomyces sp. NPDC015171 TaxID=3364945 RepID=UPI0036F9B214